MVLFHGWKIINLGSYQSYSPQLATVNPHLGQKGIEWTRLYQELTSKFL